MAQMPRSGAALQPSCSSGALHKPPQRVICSHEGQLQHFPALFPSLKCYKGIPNSYPKPPQLRLNLMFHFGCNFQTHQMLEKRTNIHICVFFFKIPSFISFEDSSDHHSRLHLSLRAAKSCAQFQTLQ